MIEVREPFTTDTGQSRVKTTCSIISARQCLICYLIAVLFGGNCFRSLAYTRNFLSEGGTLTTGSYRVLSPMHDIKYCNCEAGSLPPDQSLRSPSFSLCRRLHHPAEIEMGKYLKNCRIVLYTFLSQKVYYIL